MLPLSVSVLSQQPTNISNSLFNLLLNLLPRISYQEDLKQLILFFSPPCIIHNNPVRESFNIQEVFYKSRECNLGLILGSQTTFSHFRSWFFFSLEAELDIGPQFSPSAVHRTAITTLFKQQVKSWLSRYYAGKWISFLTLGGRNIPSPFFTVHDYIQEISRKCTNFTPCSKRTSFKPIFHLNLCIQWPSISSTKAYSRYRNLIKVKRFLATTFKEQVC